MSGVGNHGIAGVEGNGAERIEFVLHVPVRLGVFDVCKIHDVHSERAEPAVADGAAVFDAFGNGDGAVISGPGGMVPGEAIFFVFLFLAEASVREPTSVKLPAR